MCKNLLDLKVAMAATDSKDADELAMQEIELQEQKLELRKQELELRERKLALLRKRRGTGTFSFPLLATYMESGRCGGKVCTTIR